MKILRSFLIPLFRAGILLTSGLAQAIECEGDEGLFINLTSDDTWRAGMALNFANRNLDMDIPVTIFLNVEGVRVAVRRIPHHTNGLTGQTPQETLEEAMDNGARAGLSELPGTGRISATSLDRRGRARQPGHHYPSAAL